MALKFDCPLSSEYFDNVRKLNSLIAEMRRNNIKPRDGWPLMRRFFPTMSEAEWRMVREESRELFLIQHRRPQHVTLAARRLDMNGGRL